MIFFGEYFVRAHSEVSATNLIHPASGAVPYKMILCELMMTIKGSHTPFIAAKLIFYFYIYNKLGYKVAFCTHFVSI